MYSFPIIFPPQLGKTDGITLWNKYASDLEFKGREDRLLKQFLTHYLPLLHVNIEVLSVDTVAMNKGSGTASGTDFKCNLKLQSNIERLICGKKY